MRKCASLALALMLLSGCGGTPDEGDLDVLTDDDNGNGFIDVLPPDGIPFESGSNINVAFINTIEVSDLADMAADMGFGPEMLQMATIQVSYTFTLDYGGGVLDEITDSEILEPFEKAFEVACPDSVDLDVSVTVSAPLVGEVADFDVVRSTLPVTECGVTVEIESFVNDSGDIDQRVEIVPNET